jgi:hypothetical protein
VLNDPCIWLKGYDGVWISLHVNNVIVIAQEVSRVREHFIFSVNIVLLLNAIDHIGKMVRTLNLNIIVVYILLFRVLLIFALISD